MTPKNKNKKVTGAKMPERMKQTESERLYVVETKLDSVLTSVEKTHDKIDGLVDSLNKYATREQLEQAIVDRDNKIKLLMEEDSRLAHKHVLTVWVTSLLTGATGVGITMLVQRAFF